jgi:hypothetical protein
MQAVRTLGEYEALFQGADERHAAVGEGSTHYLYSRTAVPRILDYSPAACFIVCLRNPIDMAPALHNECLHQGWESVRSFEAAWRLQARRRAGQGVPRAARTDPERLLYGPYCRLGEQLDRLYRTAGSERVLTVLLDDLQRDPAGQYRRALEFLGLADDGRSRFPVVNATRPVRSVILSLAMRRAATLRNALGFRGDWGVARAIRRLNTRPTAGAGLTPQLRSELQDYFADDIGRLSDLLNRDLSHWTG